MKCAFCDKEATKLCDHPIIDEDRNQGEKEYKPYRFDRVCDLPLCDDHAIRQGTSFDLHGKGIVDSIDYCPFHDKIGYKISFAR